MSWKSFIKSLIPPIPFFPRTKRQILGLTRTAFKPTRLDTDHYLFREAEFEKDCDDIVAAFPADGPDFLEIELRHKKFSNRFQEGILCFVVREKETNQLLGAVWMSTGEYNFIPQIQKLSDNPVFQVVNLFLNSEKRGQGLGKQLLSFAIERTFATTDCEFVVSAVLEEDRRLPSLLTHLRLGFSVLGTHSGQKIFGVYLPHFVRKNTHPFFNVFPKTPIVLLTWDGPNTLGIVRSLGRHRVPLYILTPAQNTSVAWSCYVKKVLTISSLDVKTEILERLEKCKREIGSQPVKPILMVTNESHYHDLEPISDFVSEHFNVLTPLEKALPLTTHKSDQFPLAAQAGFRVMETVILQSIDDLKLVASKLAFPVLVRPMSNKIRDAVVMKTALFENEEAMRKDLTPILAKDGIELIAQEYIPGTDRDIVFFMASCDATGEPRIWLSGRKIRQNPPGRGVMAAGQVDSVPDPVFIEKSKKLCRLFGLRGFIGIECKQHAISKEYVYIESSFRPEAFNSICLSAGVDLVWDSYLAAIGEPLTKAGEDYVPDKVRVGSWADMELELGTLKELWRSGDPAWKDFFKWLPRPVAWAYFTWDDPMPWVRQTLRLLSRRMKAIFSKRQ